MLTDQELRRAVFALDQIDMNGNRHDELAAIIREANEAFPAGDGMKGLTSGVRFRCQVAAKEAANLLHEPYERCLVAAVDTLGASRQRYIYEQVVSYAIRLIGPCSELVDGYTGNYCDDCPANRKPLPQVQRIEEIDPTLPIVRRLVLDEEAVA